TSGVTYEYEIRDEDDVIVKTGIVTGLTENVTGLTGATNYTVYVRSVCSGTPGGWTTYPLSFQSACPIFDNFFEGFDSTPIGSTTNLTAPVCWTPIDEITSTGYNYVSSTYSVSPSNSYYMYRTNSTANSAENLYLISPETNNLGS